MSNKLSIFFILCFLSSPIPMYSMKNFEKGTIPILSSAKLPLYPSNARIANISGTVKLKVLTDGNNVLKVTPLEGPPMLVNASKEMVAEWKFVEHEPTDFVLTIQFELSTTESRTNDVVVFDLSNKILIRGIRTKG